MSNRNQSPGRIHRMSENYKSKPAKCGAVCISHSPTSAESMRESHEKTCPWCRVTVLEAQVKTLAEACRKARTCASLPDCVKDVIRDALCSL